eukprot:2013540-Amphidinium_carterae.1
MRLTMTPLLFMLHYQFKVCSAEWDLEQNAAAIATSQEDHEKVLCREYMITEACQGCAEQRCMKMVGELLQDRMAWSIVSDKSKHVAFNHLAFKLLSRE